jgi:hypothetical protein
MKYESDLPLPPADADFLGPNADNRSQSLGGFTIEAARYNCRLTNARKLAAAQAAQPTPVLNGWRKRLELLIK